MQVELWRHFKTVLTSVWPLLSHADKQTCNIVVKWADNQGNKYAGIASKPISQTKDWLKEIRDQYTGQIRTDLTNATTFLTRLNLKPLPDYYNTQAGCERFGFYFYDNTCNEYPRRIPAPPLPPPKPPPPPPEPPPPLPDDPGIGDFLEYDLDLQINFHNTLGYEIARDASAKVDYWNSVLGTYQVWSDIIAALDQLVGWINFPLVTIEAALEDLDKRIGDTTKLEEDNLVAAILATSGKLDKPTQAIIDYLITELNISYNEKYDSISYSTVGMWFNLKAIIAEWEAQGSQLGGVSTEAIEEILNKDYNIYTNTIDTIIRRLNKIEQEIGTSIEQIEIDVEWPTLDGAESIDTFLIASVGWVKNYVKAKGSLIFDTIDMVIDELAKPINFLLQNVYDISDPWLAKLKEKLGDVGGEYDLEADTLYQELRSEVNVIIDDIYGLPDEWVSVLANRLQGYFSTGIGEKGEKGDPGLPGARGIQGIPGVKGDPGEPGEGAGLAIDDINNRLRDKMTQAEGFVGVGITGVIDTMIALYGERFSDLQTQITPITEFLTTDMQDTLTLIAESFDTPEALIAFLLDVPEGQEDVTYELMQMLVAQIMERGLE